MEEEVEIPVEDQLRMLREEQAGLHQLLQSPVWDRLAKLIEKQIALRMPDALRILESVDQVTKQQFVAGEISALNMVKKLPAIQAEHIESEIEQLELTVENEHVA